MAQYKTSRLKHNDSSHFYYETRFKPWFGPLSNAKKALLKSKVLESTELDFLSFLQDVYPDIYRILTFVQFYKFQHRKGQTLENDRDFHIAIIYLGPDPNARTKLFADREIITDVTGWYPLVMGEKAQTIIPKKELWQHQRSNGNINQHLSIGSFRCIRSVVDLNQGGGNAFLLEGEFGNILLDTGFKVIQDRDLKINCILLSHFHTDHSGGVWEIIERGVPLLLTEPTLRYLYDKSSKKHNQKKQLLQSAIVIEKIQAQLKNNHNIQVFSPFHAPGSIGFALHDAADQCVIYPGDLCLKNGFLDYSNTFWAEIHRLKSAQTYLLLDASMVANQNTPIYEDDTPDQILQGLIADLEKRNVIVTSQSVETLVYEYILTFLSTRKVTVNGKAVKLVISNGLSRICQTLLGPMLYRKNEFVDPFIQSVVGKGLSNFIESYRVYSIASLKLIDPRENVIIFATPGDIMMNPDIQTRIRGGNVVLAGTLALRHDNVPSEISSSLPRTILRVSSPDWSFHSYESDLADFIWKATKENIHVILFHANRNSLKTFIQNYPMNPKLVSIIDEQGISL